MTLDLAKPSDLDLLVEMLAQRLVAYRETKSEHITCAEARKELGITQQTLAIRLAERGIETYYHGREKAFDRTDLIRLKNRKARKK